MPLPASSFEELFAFEENLETGFVYALTQAGLPRVGRSRSSQIFETPYHSLWVTNGNALDSQHAITGLVGALLPYRAFSATLFTETVTDRNVDRREREHSINVAKLRKNLQLFRLQNYWLIAQQIQIPFDIREAGSENEIDDEHGLDITRITWNVRHAINEAAWPAGLAIAEPPTETDTVIRKTGSYSITNGVSSFDITFPEAFQSVPAFADVNIQPPDGQPAISVYSVTRLANKLTVVLDTAIPAVGYSANWFAILA